MLWSIIAPEIVQLTQLLNRHEPCSADVLDAALILDQASLDSQRVLPIVRALVNV